MNGGDTFAVKGHLNPGATPPVARYPAAADLAELVRQHWVPEWSLPAGRSVTARVLGYPGLNLVVERSGVVLHGPTRGASERMLEGSGWAVGTLLRPASTIALGADAEQLVDAEEHLGEPGLRREVLAAMEREAPAAERHLAAVGAVQRWLRQRLHEPGAQGRLANEAVAVLESGTVVHRVADLAGMLHVTPRTLQRAVRRCTGMSPHELLRRHRLQEAADRLRRGDGRDLSRVAAETGYADHAHLSREFRGTLRQTPRDFRGHR